MRTISWVASAALLLVATAQGATQQPPPQADAAATLIAEFRAGDWTRRQAAFEQLLKEPQLLSVDQKKDILTEVLKRENNEIDTAFREGGGVSQKYGESYGEYAAELGGYLFSLIDVQDVAALAAIAQTAYHANGPYAQRLAAYGEALVPAILKLADSDISPNRWQAFGLAGGIHRLSRQRATKSPLSDAALAQLKAVLLAGTRDEDIANRQIAVRNLGVAGLAEFLPLLESIVQTDPAVSTLRGAAEYPVRDEARKAIVRIRSGQ